MHEKVLAAAKINSRAAKMGIYGAFISAPMNHVLVGKLQKLFAGKTSTRARLLQLLVGNVFIAPIQAAGESLAQNTFEYLPLNSLFGVYDDYFWRDKLGCNRSYGGERDAPYAEGMNDCPILKEAF